MKLFMMQIITFSADTGQILDYSSRTTGAFHRNASSLVVDLPPGASRILTRDELGQMRASPQSTTSLPQNLSPSFSETWQKAQVESTETVRDNWFVL